MGALARDIARGGTSAGSAQAINGSVATALTAAGTTISNALDLNATVNVIGTCVSGAGVQLYSMQVGDEMEVYNGGANQCLVYPDSATIAINQMGVGNGITLAVNTGAKFRKVSSTAIIAFLSA